MNFQLNMDHKNSGPFKKISFFCPVLIAFYFFYDIITISEKIHYLKEDMYGKTI